MKKDKLNSSLLMILKTSAVVFLGVIISKIFTYIYRIIIARNFGPEIYGVFSLATIILGVFMTFCLLGFSEGILKYASSNGKNNLSKVRYAFRFSLKILLIVSILGFAILFIFSKTIALNLFNNQELVYFLRIFSFLIPISVMGALLLSTLRGFEKVKEYSFAFNISQNVLKVIAVLLLLWLGLKTDSVVYSYFISILGMLAIAYYFCKREIPEIFGKPVINAKEKKNVRLDFIKYSLPLMFFGIISTIFYWIDSLAIGYFKSAYEVGIYNAMVPIAVLIFIIPEIFIQIFFPLINKEHSNKNSKLIKDLSKQIGKWIFMIAAPIFILIYLFPGVIINLLFGSEYIQGQTALRILMVGIFVLSISYVSQNLILMIGKSKTILYNILYASILNLILNIILVPMNSIFSIDNTSGLIGASISTAISMCFLAFLQFYQSKKMLNILPLRRKMLSIFFISLVLGLLLYYIRSFFKMDLVNLILFTITFFVFYLAAIFLFKALDRHDLQVILSLKNKFLGDKWKKTFAQTE
jgi:O-antigen/teichoic acid export membrane protein